MTLSPERPAFNDVRNWGVSRSDLNRERCELEGDAWAEVRKAANAETSCPGVLFHPERNAAEVFGGIKVNNPPVDGRKLHLNELIFLTSDIRAAFCSSPGLEERLRDEFPDREFTLEPTAHFDILVNIGGAHSPEGIARWREPHAGAYVLVSRPVDADALDVSAAPRELGE